MGKGDQRVLNWLGIYYLNQKMYEEARIAFVDAFNLDPDKDPDGMLRSVEILLVYGSPAEAETMLNQVRGAASAKMTDDERLRMLRVTAQIQLASGKEAEAIKTLEEVLRKDPTDGRSMLILGNYYAKQSREDVEHAADHTARALMNFELASNRPEVKREAFIEWARLLVDRREYTKAIGLLRKAQDLEFKENVENFIDQLEQLVRNRI